MTGIWHEVAGAGDPVVLLHAGTADARMWDPQWEALTASFRVVRLEFRGYGRSPWAADGPYSDDGDVAALLDSLGMSEVAVVGASYGGRVALELATGHPGLVSRLVLLNAGCGLPETPDMEEFGAEEMRLIEAGDIAGAADLNARTWLGPEADEVTRARLAEMQRDAFEVQLKADPEPERLRGELDPARIQAPTLVVSGERDLVYFQETARHLARTMPQASLLRLDWAGHLPSLERPAETTRIIQEFLTGRS
ncbi:alpha/beta hydrolase [Microtetraspora sp. NBRC 16547]|uniref:alpha/beta fold hydrolase n=1 Tax=Microtetraspora sp. NBRC 16547 TaxID=3030993 RepID=UPI00249FC31B|nr:alpha/beta hydrolase [Microtetraspora sp. NBRC 16547]GLX00052.1 hydrolase [Microtetraspora sp. NBRC 16547]